MRTFKVKPSWRALEGVLAMEWRRCVVGLSVCVGFGGVEWVVGGVEGL